MKQLQRIIVIDRGDIQEATRLKFCPCCQCEYPSTENFCQIDGVPLAEMAAVWKPFTPEAFVSCLEDARDWLECITIFKKTRRVIPCAEVAFSLLFSNRAWRLCN